MNDAFGTPARILLVGGTSDIGLAIVRRLLRRTHETEVWLAARPSERRQAAARQLGGDHVTVHEIDFDARDTASHPTALAEVWEAGDVDVVIVAFGVLGEQSALLEDPGAAVDLVTTNYTGAVSTGLLAASRLREQGHGRIIALSSVAGERARRSNFVYGSSKAGFDAFFSGLADELHGSGVSVTVVRPGFVRSRMTVGREPTFLSTDPETVAEAAVSASRKGRPLVWVPAPLRLVMLVARLLPRAIFRRLEF